MWWNLLCSWCFFYDFVCLRVCFFSARCCCFLVIFRVVLLLLCPSRPSPPSSFSSSLRLQPGIYQCSWRRPGLLSLLLPPFLFLSVFTTEPPLPFVNPLTSISLSSVCVCPFCDVIPEDTDSPSWTNSGLSLLLLHLLPFTPTGPPLRPLLLHFHSFSYIEQA